MAPTTLGDRLREARLQKGLTLERAAEQIGVKLNTVWRYEKGEIQPSEPVLRLCSQVYERTIEWFLGQDEFPTQKTSGDLRAMTDREIIMSEPMVALRTARPDLSEDAMADIADYIKFVHEREQRRRRERQGEG